MQSKQNQVPISQRKLRSRTIKTDLANSNLASTVESQGTNKLDKYKEHQPKSQKTKPRKTYSKNKEIALKSNDNTNNLEEIKERLFSFSDRNSSEKKVQDRERVSKKSKKNNYKENNSKNFQELSNTDEKIVFGNSFNPVKLITDSSGKTNILTAKKDDEENSDHVELYIQSSKSSQSDDLSNRRQKELSLNNNLKQNTGSEKILPAESSLASEVNLFDVKENLLSMSRGIKRSYFDDESEEDETDEDLDFCFENFEGWQYQ